MMEALEPMTAKKVAKKKGVPESNVNLTDPFRALQHPLRRELLERICVYGSEGVIFTDLWNEYEGIMDKETGKPAFSKPNISQHLTKLALSGLVIVRREGGYKRYFPNAKVIRQFKEFADKVAE